MDLYLVSKSLPDGESWEVETFPYHYRRLPEDGCFPGENAHGVFCWLVEEVVWWMVTKEVVKLMMLKWIAGWQGSWCYMMGMMMARDNDDIQTSEFHLSLCGWKCCHFPDKKAPMDDRFDALSTMYWKTNLMYQSCSKTIGLTSTSSPFRQV